MINAALKSNFQSVLTDCPHREKLGWLECSHLLAGCVMYNYDGMKRYVEYGRIVSNWKKEADQLTMEVTIPMNTTATVYVPAKDAAGVTESGKPADQAEVHHRRW